MTAVRIAPTIDVARAAWRARRLLAGAAALLLTGAAGCATTPTDPASVLEERWRMAGEQRTPVPSRFEGELVWTAQRGDRLDGQVDLLVQEAAGTAVRRAGLVTGRVDGDALEFDVQLATGTARYVGTRRGDTVSGTWLDDGSRGSGMLAAGSFRLERRR